MNTFLHYLKNPSNELNTINRLHRYFGFKEKEILINSFVYANFNYCPLICHFCSSTSVRKTNKFKQGHLEFCTIILIAITKLF